jgi:membrane-bound lytic murein transglycosylase B
MLFRWVFRVCLAVLLFSAGSVSAGEREISYDKDPEVLAWVDRVNQKYAIDKKELIRALSEVQNREKILNAMDPTILNPDNPRLIPKKNWQRYLANVLDVRRIAEGRDFMMQHRELLDRAYLTYGVPPEIITALIGIETRYGAYTGRFYVFDALVVLAFDYHKRKELFLSQLEDYLILCGRFHWPLREKKGSFAGAMGLPQFMPTSILKFAVDFDGDGVVNLYDSRADVIGSVANFLKEHGWRRGLSAHYSTRYVSTQASQALVSAKPNLLSRAEMSSYAVDVASVPTDIKVALIDLPNETDLGSDGTDYVLGTENFFVLTRYNRSFFYATSATIFSEVLKQNNVGETKRTEKRRLKKKS